MPVRNKRLEAHNTTSGLLLPIIRRLATRLALPSSWCCTVSRAVMKHHRYRTNPITAKAMVMKVRER